MMDVVLDFLLATTLSYLLLYSVTFLLTEWLLLDRQGDLFVSLVKSLLYLDGNLSLVDADLLLLLTLLLVTWYAAAKVLLIRQWCCLATFPVVALLSYGWFRWLMYSIASAHYTYIVSHL